MFKMLFNLIVLGVLCVGAFYIYINTSENYELMAEIQNTKDRLLVQMQEFVDEMKDDLRQMKDDVDQMKRSAGF